ncbi:MAG: GNAT family N-acetyltransferase [Bacteroidales bacterium]|nr:GNAT family N-acetyltransferase [Saprospiraceae bacterium]MCF8381570.1 GNAT family N-acetyltransferase [Bacteroidales bacterium]
MIEKLDWDSEFFGYPVGRIILDESENNELALLLKEQNQYRLVYIVSKKVLPVLENIFLTDRKVVFVKSLNKDTKACSLIEFDTAIHSYSELLDLALLSGIYSRFRNDKNFRNNEFSRLYKQWIDNSISNDNTNVLIEIKKGRIAGFITVENKPEKRAQIGLIAVNEEFQGQQIGSLLVKESEYKAIENGNEFMQVTTQSLNIPAVRLYEKSNYHISSISYIYHYWNR